jgi:gluconate 5-dehydrogenase
MRALVTGGGSGLGLAIARGLALAGAAIAINGRNRDKLAAAVKELASDGIEARMAPFDVTDVTAVTAGVAEVERAMGSIDILVNNAAMNQRKALEEFTPDEWRSLMAANLDGPFLVTRAVLPAMKARKSGKIVNICSLASRHRAAPHRALRGEQGALRMLTRALAVELAPHNIQANGIAPGFFKTQMNAPLIADQEFSAWVAKRTPAGRWGDPAEICRRRGVPGVAGRELCDRPPALRRRGFSAAY